MLGRLTVAALLMLPMPTASLIPAGRAQQTADEVRRTKAIEGDIPFKIPD